MKKIIACIIALLIMASLCACSSLSAAQQDSANDLPSPTEEPETPIDSGTEEDWKTDFEASLLAQYGVTPDRYEDLGDGIFQVYVIIDGKSVPYVTVDSATGDYHG